MKVELIVNKDTKQLDADLLSMVSRATKTSQAILFQEASIIMENSYELVPEDTGALLRSGYVNRNPIGFSAGTLVAAVRFGYGAPSINDATGLMASEYMIAVHEDLSIIHETGEAKFLEKAVMMRSDDYRMNLAEGLSEIFIRKETYLPKTKATKQAEKFASGIGDRSKRFHGKQSSRTMALSNEAEFFKRRIKELQRDENDFMMHSVNIPESGGPRHFAEITHARNQIKKHPYKALEDPFYKEFHAADTMYQNAVRQRLKSSNYTQEQKYFFNMEAKRARKQRDAVIDKWTGKSDNWRINQIVHAEENLARVNESLTSITAGYGGKDKMYLKGEEVTRRMETYVHKMMLESVEGRSPDKRRAHALQIRDTITNGTKFKRKKKSKERIPGADQDVPF